MTLIIAKVWLIGRSYAAAIERRRETGGILGDKFYEECVGPGIRKEKIDDWFQAPSSAPNSNLALYLETHKKVMALFRKISGEDKPSLASKYLHFHFPSRFYICDARAAAAIALLTDSVAPPPGYDNVYARFFVRCEALNKAIDSLLGRRLSPRDLDKVLLYEAARGKPANGACAESPAG